MECIACGNAREVHFCNPRRLCGRNALVQRHARHTPNDLACCVLTPPSGRRRELRVNFPLSTYSVFDEENVSRGNENNCAMSKRRIAPSLDQDKTVPARSRFQGFSLGWLAAIHPSTIARESLASRTISSASVCVATEEWSQSMTLRFRRQASKKSKARSAVAPSASPTTSNVKR